MTKVLIIVCSGTFNRGTEALIRGTIQILQRTFDDLQITTASSTPDLDSQLKLPKVVSYVSRVNTYKRFSIMNLYEKTKRTLDKNYKNYSALVNVAKDQDLVLVVGADNYDVAYNLYPSLHKLNALLKENCRGKLFLFDCSLNKESVTRQFIDEAKLFDAFSVREEETQSNLQGKYDGDNFYYFPDPAFVMPATEISLPAYWKENKMIGLNLSTLIVSSNYGLNLYEKVLSAYKYLIDKILNETEFEIVLIPHVMGGADLKILREIKALYKNNGRVHLVSNEKNTAPELKYIISKCRFFIGARTHATIAAYSSCVPTLVLGYSTKSIGIAKDLFGTTEGYVVPVQKLEEKEELWEKFFNILNNEEKIKSHLNNIMPDYQAKVYSMSDIFKRLLS